ncbi:MAG: SOS response-associated peptidase [Cyclobacteriaceae bacterium]
MIDRYAIYSVPEEVSAHFGIHVDEGLKSQYNAAPTKRLPVIANAAKDGLSYFYWGIIAKWSNKKSISSKWIHAKKEDILKKSTLKTGLEQRRCIIPANGLYLWKTVGKRSKRPYFFKLNDRSLFGFAGIWEDYDDLDGKMLHTFKIITTENKLGLPEFGDQMPAILTKTDEVEWLKPNQSIETLLQMVKPLDSISNIHFHPVAPFITKIDNDFPEMINIQPSIDQKGNYTLFE